MQIKENFGSKIRNAFCLFSPSSSFATKHWDEQSLQNHFKRFSNQETTKLSKENGVKCLNFCHERQVVSKCFQPSPTIIKTLMQKWADYNIGVCFASSYRRHFVNKDRPKFWVKKLFRNVHLQKSMYFYTVDTIGARPKKGRHNIELNRWSWSVLLFGKF